MVEEIDFINCPSFINATGALDAWSYSNGRFSEVRVADTCIDVQHEALSGKSQYSSIEDKEECTNLINTNFERLSALKQAKNKENQVYLKLYKEYMHGTAIAGLIVSDVLVFTVDPLRDLATKYSNNGVLNVCGVAPGSSILGIENTSWKSFEKGFAASSHEDSDGNKVFEERRRIKNVVLNLSGGQEQKSSILSPKGEWTRVIKEHCNDDFYLAITAVGNDKCNLDKEEGCKGILPSILKKPSSCKNDILLRVGAVSVSSTGEVQMYYKSNYGKNTVDLLAPGAGIASLTPRNYSSVDSGSSLATAIVSGAVALLSSCNPFASASLIRQALIDNADIHEHLKDYAQGGRVLNISRSIRNFCLNHALPSDCSAQPTQSSECYRI